VDVSLPVASMLLSVIHQNNHLVKVPNLLLLQFLNQHPMPGILLNLKIIRPRYKQVVNRLIINFQIRDPNIVFVLGVLRDGLEYMLDSAR
jgi:hypothetical protein